MGELVQLDDHRPHKSQYLLCGFCGKHGEAKIITGRAFYACPDTVTGCDEIAASPWFRVFPN